MSKCSDVMLQRALEWARHWGPVFPCATTKRPLTKRGFHDATLDEDQIAYWWGKRPEAMIGFPTGAKTGIVALDIDVDPTKGIDGRDTLIHLPTLAETFTVLTPRGGSHCYYQHPGVPIGCTTGKLGLGIDTRGDGGYVIAPGSMIPWLGSYEVEASSLPNAVPMDPWLIERLSQSAPTERTREYTGDRAEADEIRSALNAIEPDITYEDWVTMGMALHAWDANHGLYLWDEWSCQGDKYSGIKDLEYHWDSFKSDGGVTLGTLFKQAMDRGWENPNFREVKITGKPPGKEPPKAPLDGDDLHLPTLGEFKRLEFPPVVPLFGPFKSNQIAIIAALPGVGKTQMVLAMAYAMASGGKWGHWHAPRPLKVLILDGEMSGAEMQARWGMYDDKADENITIVNVVNWAADNNLPHVNLAEERWQKQLLIWSEGFDVVFADNMMSLVSVTNTSMSSDEFWKPMYYFGLKQRAAGRTLVCVDHANSNNEIFGTKTKLWNVDLGMVLTRTNEDLTEGCDFEVRFQKIRNAVDDDTREFKAKLSTNIHGKASWIFEDLGEYLEAQIRAWVSSGLAEREIAAELGITRGRVRGLKKKMGLNKKPDEKQDVDDF